ncbi:MAG: nuclear transport factor 2 family protein [Thermoleophilaceae bacterium]
MSQENVELARRGYVALNEALRSGDFLSAVQEFCDPEIVLKPAGILPESREMRGHEGMVQFMGIQAEAFEGFSVEPQEFIDAGDEVVVPVRFGGRAVHTGLDVHFEVVHVCTAHGGKWKRIDVYAERAQALEAVGLSE